MIKNSGYLIIFLLFFYCKTDDTIPDCSVVLCATPMVIVNLVDDDTKENIIIQENILKENITIQDTSENSVEFIINKTNGFLYVSKNNIEDTFQIMIDSEISVVFSFNTSYPKTNECCDFGTLTEFTVVNKTFTLEENKITIYLQ